MKPVLMFILESCPYCHSALKWMEELKQENPKYANIETKIIDEDKHPDISEKHDYYYVPTYYVDGIKVHEGAASKEIVKAVFDRALV